MHKDSRTRTRYKDYFEKPDYEDEDAINMVMEDDLSTPTKFKDTLKFMLQDSEGDLGEEETLSIILQEDRNPPRVTLNTGVTVEEDGRVAITADKLSVSDSETDPMLLQYMVSILPVFYRCNVCLLNKNIVNLEYMIALLFSIFKYC